MLCTETIFWQYGAAALGAPDEPSVEVPIFMVARASAGLYTTTLTASSDVTSMVVNPTQSPQLYQHADLFLADGAAAVIWRPILEWIEAHR